LGELTAHYFLGMITMSEDASQMDPDQVPFTEEVVVGAYCHGYFPMGNPDDDIIRWYRPDPRAVIPLDRFHIPRSLKRFIRKEPYSVRFNVQFEEVMRLCREAHGDSWITPKMIEVYTRMHHRGYAHSVEIYSKDQLSGGLYGVSIGGLFCGESMFFLKSNYSKIALVELVKRLRDQSMVLLDTQFTNNHIDQFNVTLIPDDVYYQELQRAISLPIRFA
jgi:leucyl/phenylalanyl-tRNA--protein transferase